MLAILYFLRWMWLGKYVHFVIIYWAVHLWSGHFLYQYHTTTIQFILKKSQLIDLQIVYEAQISRRSPIFIIGMGFFLTVAILGKEVQGGCWPPIGPGNYWETPAPVTSSLVIVINIQLMFCTFHMMASIQSLLHFFLDCFGRQNSKIPPRFRVPGVVKPSPSYSVTHQSAHWYEGIFQMGLRS